MELTKTNVTKWLNEKIKAYKILRQDVLVPEQDEKFKYVPAVGKCLELHSDKMMHFDSKAVRMIAKIMDYPLSVVYSEDSEYPYELSFRYKGFKFFCIETAEDYVERGAVE